MKIELKMISKRICTLSLFSLINLLLLTSCNPFSSNNSEKASPTLEDELTGVWFPCEEFSDESINIDCHLVDDDGLIFSSENNLTRIDGAKSYSDMITNDTTVSSYFNVEIDSLYFFAEPEVFSGCYSLQNDTLIIDGYSVEGDSIHILEIVPFRVENEILTLLKDHPDRYRKYTGQANLIIKKEWEDLMYDSESTYFQGD